MGHNIKIDGDFSSVKKGVLELSKELKGLSKKSDINLFTKEDSELLSRQTLDITKSLEKELEKITRNADRYKKVMKNNTLSAEKQVKAAKSYNAALKERVSIRKSLGQIKDFDEETRGTSKLRQMGGGLQKGIGSIPGTGKLQGLKGMGLMGGLGLGVGALGAFGAYKGYKGYQQFKGGAAQRLKMAGRGIEDTSGINESLGKLGYGAEEVRNQQLKGVNTFGKEGATQGAVLQRAQFERGRGLDKGAMTEASQGMRGSLGAKGTQEAMFKLQATILANNITDNIGPFLETSAAMLTSMNENGLPADTEVLALMASMTKGGTSEARAMQQIMSANQAVKTSTGDSNAFLQTMFAGQGIGGGTVGGSQEAIRMGGLFGVDEGKMESQFGMSKSQIESYKTLGITGEGTGFKGRTSGILDYSKDNFGQGPQEDLRKGEFFKNIFGTQSGGEALGFLNKLEKAQGDPKEIAKVEKEIKEASKSPEIKIQEDIKASMANLEGIDSRIEGLTGTQNMHMEALGASLSGVGASMGEALTSIDGGVSAIAKFLTGYESPSEIAAQKETRKQERIGNADEVFSQKGLSRESLGQMSPEEVRTEGKSLRSQYQSNEKSIKAQENLGAKGGKDFEKIAELKEQNVKLTAAIQELVKISKENAEANKKTSKNTQGSKAPSRQSLSRGRN